MKYESFYFIRPAQTLKDRLRGSDPDIAELMSEPHLWTKREGGLTIDTEEDYIAQVKVLFLINLWSEYVIGAGEDKSLKLFLEEIMGPPPFTKELFDRWWTVERFEGYDESFEEIAERLGAEHMHLAAKSDLPLVEYWMSKFDKRVPA
jgi:hypothetical protein